MVESAKCNDMVIFSVQNVLSNDSSHVDIVAKTEHTPGMKPLS